ncbi:MAG: TIGR02266 family protein [Proteobacteria bacterium]|nr:TIGR02266 family protein [Pseudomonadota bacterium]
MTTSQEHIEATAQLDRARATLGQALGQTQDISNSDLNVGQISKSLAGAVKCIFTVQSEGLAAPQSRENVAQSMAHLRQTLRLLQDVQGRDPSLALVTGTIARILALIYPVSKLLEDMAPVPKVEESEPLRLTEEMAKPTTTEDTPIPLVEKARLSEVPVVRQRESIAPGSKERRYSDRRSLKVDIGVQSDTNFFTGFSQDISSGGLFVATYDVLSAGTTLNVNFSLPRGPVLSLDGTVCWIREYNETTPDILPGMGIHFDNLADEDKQAINQFIAKNPPIFYDAD